ncbi:maternal effect embryo arrest [Trema orientale]|uniref:Maternal effect embryo arrest n=1 Tax=Trema orientale TaxID=63057 RepID=A0A2P5CP17_TREOI|nr:maternal effect embryo arrest [Trema orientale]
MERCNRRPNRSDIHLSIEEEAKIEAKTRDYFDGVIPKRHTKPQRSEYSSRYVDDFASETTNNGFIPEYVEFQRLEHEEQEKLVYKGNKVEEEFVETEYYKDLNCVDKQHHTTGTGFIKVENTDEKCYNLGSDSVPGCHASSKCNPATNDWIPVPEAANMIPLVSAKPNRSDS